jgi:hypothetical protein
MHMVGETSKGSIDSSVTFSYGDISRYDDATDTWYLANHTSEANAKGMLGVYLGGNEFLTRGILKTSGLNKAATYLLGSTNGSYTTTEPDTEDYVLRVVGYAKSAQELVFDPDDSYYTLGADADDDVTVMMETLNQILVTLRVINLHLSVWTDNEVKDHQVIDDE